MYNLVQRLVRNEVKIYAFLPLILLNCFRDILSKNKSPADRSIDSGGT